jgi:hypothetical protein
MSGQPFTSNEIANTMRDTVGNDDWRGIPLGVRYRLIKATRTLLADLAVRLDDEHAAEATYDDGYGDGWDDGRLVGHYLEWGQQHTETTERGRTSLTQWMLNNLSREVIEDNTARSRDAVEGMATYPPLDLPSGMIRQALLGWIARQREALPERREEWAHGAAETLQDLTLEIDAIFGAPKADA